MVSSLFGTSLYWAIHTKSQLIHQPSQQTYHYLSHSNKHTITKSADHKLPPVVASDGGATVGSNLVPTLANDTRWRAATSPDRADRCVAPIWSYIASPAKKILPFSGVCKNCNRRLLDSPTAFNPWRGTDRGDSWVLRIHKYCFDCPQNSTNNILASPNSSIMFLLSI